VPEQDAHRQQANSEAGCRRSRNQLRGTDAIKPLFQALVAEFRKPGATFSMQQQFVEGIRP
jgi:hypothetical protein